MLCSLEKQKNKKENKNCQVELFRQIGSLVFIFFYQQIYRVVMAIVCKYAQWLFILNTTWFFWPKEWSLHSAIWGLSAMVTILVCDHHETDVISRGFRYLRVLESTDFEFLEWAF